MAQRHEPGDGSSNPEQATDGQPDQRARAGFDGPPGEQPASESAAQVPDEDTLLNELLQERARAAEYLDQAQRARAEMINYRRRMEQEMQQVRQHAGERMLTRILPVLDDFHRAIQAVPAEQASEPWVQGVHLIERKLWTVLEAEGVRPIEAVGRRFDPSLHEAVTVEEGDGEADTVVQEFQRGYTLHERVLRPAMVKVGRGSGRTADGN
ncbi:MAG TPA: nucleotide exchange factor GrpE [Thermomicrobiaceae bacterium]|nr:nucleotide exchange factor GrpE [Thermomicrobiaceae bacterium]